MAGTPYSAPIEPLSGMAGAYASPWPAWLDATCAYTDYFWFAALFGWSLVLMLWWSCTRRHAEHSWRWLPWTAATAWVSCAVVFFDLITARLGSSPREANSTGDFALIGLTLVMVSGWWWEAGRAAGGRLGRFYHALIILPLALFVRTLSMSQHGRVWPVIFSYTQLLCSLAIVTVVPWWLMKPRRTWSIAGITFAAVLPICSTVGPLAMYVLFMRERFGAAVPLSVIWASGQATLAFALVFALARMELKRLDWRSRTEWWRQARPFLAGAAACLLLGLITASFVGRRQHRSAEERALDQARLAAVQIDPDVIARLLGPAFHLDFIEPHPTTYYPPGRYAISHFFAGGGEAEARGALLKVARASRSTRFVRILTKRDGWLVGVAGYCAPDLDSVAPMYGTLSMNQKAPLKPALRGFMLLARQPTAEDEAAWNEKREWVEGPTFTPVFTNGVVFARAPIVARDGTMLGWLELTYAADAFFAETFQSRIAPFTGSILGVLLVALLYVQRRHAKEREAALTAAAVAAETSRIKTEFLATVSHELRTPLQTILASAQLLERDITTSNGRARLSIHRQQGELMLRLVNDLIDLAAIDTGAFRLIEKTIDPGQVVRDTVETLRPKARAKNLVLRCTVQPDVPAGVSADAERLRQIVLNLVGNAVKFTPAGEVLVDLACEREAARPDSPLPVLLELTVRDTGPGIPAADQVRLFQPFSRLEASRETEGAGLGLALAAGLCRAMGGSLTVASDGHSGSSFRARLQLRPAQPPAQETARGEAAALTNKRVLVADDNTLVRQLFVAYLQARGAHCETAVDGEDAVARIMTGRFDVVILDLAMPRLDGVGAARALRDANLESRPRIIGVSAHAAAAERERALSAGMDAFLTKPVELDALAAAVAGANAQWLSRKPADSHLSAQLGTLFRQEASAQAGRVEKAMGNADWPGLVRAAHYLKNSAGVIGDDVLFTACGQLEEAAADADESAVRRAWKACENALEKWR